MVLRRWLTHAAACLAVLVAATAAHAQAPVFASPAVNGNAVTLTWSATAGATGYRLDYGLSSGAYAGSLPVGLVTSFAIPAAPNGVFYMRVVALTPGGDVPSNEVQLRVPSPPAVPTGLTVARNGTGLVASWSPGVGGGSASGYRLYVGTSPGGTLAVLPSNTTSWGIASGVPSNTYYMRVTAVNAAGESGPSSEVAVVMPVGGACDAPPAPTLTTVAWGGYMTASWTPVAGASTYRFNYDGAGYVGQIAFGGTQTLFAPPVNLPPGTWQFSVQAVFSCGQAGTPGPSTLVLDNSSLKLQPRAPDPATGVPAYASSVINDMAARYPGDLLRSCKETGGNNVWLFRVLQELRTRDKRWGLNWKRANFGDMSQDVITYNWGDEGDEGTQKLRAWDIIGGHCGGRPGAQFSEITNPMPPQWSTNARWTLIPYIQAGYTP